MPAEACARSCAPPQFGSGTNGGIHRTTAQGRTRVIPCQPYRRHPLVSGRSPRPLLPVEEVRLTKGYVFRGAQTRRATTFVPSLNSRPNSHRNRGTHTHAETAAKAGRRVHCLPAHCPGGAGSGHTQPRPDHRAGVNAARNYADGGTRALAVPRLTTSSAHPNLSAPRDSESSILTPNLSNLIMNSSCRMV